jgi:hypothetical protein
LIINKKCWDYEVMLSSKEEHRELGIEVILDELKAWDGTIPEPLPPSVAET